MSRTSLFEACRNALVALAIAGFALAAPPAGAEDDLPVAVVQSKNPVQRTVTIDDQTFDVTETTRILDLAGRPLRFEQVRTAEEEGALVRIDRVTYAYEARGRVLTVLRQAPVPR